MARITQPRLAAKGDSTFMASVRSGMKSYGGIAVVAAVVVMVSLFILLSQVTARTTYYVLKAAVPARTQVTPDMLQAVDVSRGGAPTAYLTPAQVASGQTYTKIALAAGEIITASSAGPLQRINATLPPNFVAASVKVPADDAVGGKIRTGDYIDVIATASSRGGAGTAKVVLYHALVLDVTVAPSTIAKSASDGVAGSKVNAGVESKVMREGVPSIYTLGLTPKDATVLAAVRDANLMLVLSSNTTSSLMNASTDLGTVFTPGAVPDSGAGTQPTQPAQAPQTARQPQAQPSTSAPTK